MTKLNILFLPAPGWYPDKNNPVRGVFVQEHAHAASLYNNLLILYGEPSKGKLKNIYDIISDECENKIRTVRFEYKFCINERVSYIFYALSILKIFEQLKKEGWECNILHAHVYLAGLPAVLIGRKFKLPVLISEHSSAFPRKMLDIFGLTLARFVFARADLILPVSSYLKEHMEAQGISNKFEVVPNTIDCTLFYPPVTKQKNIRRIILFVGLLLPIKGINFLLDSLASICLKRKDFILFIVGDGPCREEYEGLVQKLALNGHVQFLGSKSKKEVADLMRTSDFYVHPSLVETFGISYVEAMACGNPVIGTSIPALREKTKPENGLVVPPGDRQALTQAIDFMLDNYQTYSATKISHRVRLDYSHEAIGSKLNAIYHQLA